MKKKTAEQKIQEFADSVASSSSWMMTPVMLNSYKSIYGSGIFDEPALPLCRMCGEKGDAHTEISVCRACMKKYGPKWLRDHIKRSTLKHFCKSCYSHIKACRCEKTKALKRLHQ
jgi:hypothetical protein